jgi:hypothetical protein
VNALFMRHHTVDIAPAGSVVGPPQSRRGARAERAPVQPRGSNAVSDQTVFFQAAGARSSRPPPALWAVGAGTAAGSAAGADATVAAVPSRGAAFMLALRIKRRAATSSAAETDLFINMDLHLLSLERRTCVWPT